MFILHVVLCKTERSFFWRDVHCVLKNVRLYRVYTQFEKEMYALNKMYTKNERMTYGRTCKVPVEHVSGYQSKIFNRFTKCLTKETELQSIIPGEIFHFNSWRLFVNICYIHLIKNSEGFLRISQQKLWISKKKLWFEDFILKKTHRRDDFQQLLIICLILTSRKYSWVGSNGFLSASM